jgi:hypothetical protein
MILSIRQLFVPSSLLAMKERDGHDFVLFFFKSVEIVEAVEVVKIVESPESLD